MDRSTPSPRQAGNGLGSDILQTIAVQVVTTGAAAAVTVITSYALGPAGRGLMVLALLAGRVAEMSVGLGLGHALMYFRARQRWSQAELAGAAYGIWGALTLVLGPAAVVVALMREALLPPGLSGAAPLLVAAVVSGRLLHYLAGSVLLGAGGLRTYVRLTVWEGTLTALLCLVGGVTGGLTVEGALAAHAAGAVVMGTGAALRLGFSVQPPTRSLLWSCLKYGGQVQVGQAALFLNYRLDTFLVGSLRSLHEVGLYSAAVAVSELVLRLPGAVNTALYPAVARTSTAKGAAITQQVSRLLVPLVAVTCLLIGAGGGLLIGLLFGPAFAGALFPTRLLLPGTVALTLFKLLYHDLAGRGKPGVGMAATLAGLAATVLLDLALIPGWGIAGAAFASTLAYSISALWVLTAFVRDAGCSPLALLLPARSDLTLVRSALLEAIGALRKGGRSS